MTTIAMLLLGYPLGAKAQESKRAALWITIAFGLVLAVQTPLVAADSSDDNSLAGWAVYVVINAVTLAIGLGLGEWAVRRQARRQPAAGVEA
jgi:4-hydroxybenzoate polyprenyltransferase